MAIGLTVVLMAQNSLARDLKPVWLESDDYAELEVVSARHDHPAQLTAAQIQGLLGRVYKQENGDEPVPYFSDDELRRLPASLATLFAKAKPSDDILFGSSFRQRDMLFASRSLNAGRLFVEEGQLNLIIGTCAEPLDVGYRRFHRHRQLNHGSRIKPVSNLPCELVEMHAATRVDKRPDWISVPLTLGPVRVITNETSVAQPKINKASKAAAPAKAAAQPATVLPPPGASRMAERLQVLKQLHKDGLINDAEYEQKRAAILKDL
ncbi:SHOCT domain-containing protein [Chitinimonas sp. BJYL2]|uniref:SHOCT domain-containing protein n=1 Tax=Chitinimonas sp. BJYL2 TaxID=2976696 RepID=UPI0022B320EB|nr:SHOCT domain-containing protein [Chitinimonas sp. BJYL2]